MKKIHISWESTNLPWNEVAASIIEHFGLPGDKYQTEITEDHMNFNFYHEHDALMCKILVSDCI
jgi:hypothetical protein